MGQAELALGRLRTAARNSARQFRALAETAQEAGNISEAESYSRAEQEAAEKEEELTAKMESELLNPAGDKVVSLTAKTAELEARIERMKQSTQKLKAAAAVLSILGEAVQIALLL